MKVEKVANVYERHNKLGDFAIVEVASAELYRFLSKTPKNDKQRWTVKVTIEAVG